MRLFFVSSLLSDVIFLKHSVVIFGRNPQIIKRVHICVHTSTIGVFCITAYD